MSIATLPQDNDGAMAANDSYSYQSMRRHRAYNSFRQLTTILPMYDKVHASRHMHVAMTPTASRLQI